MVLRLGTKLSRVTFCLLQIEYYQSVVLEMSAIRLPFIKSVHLYLLLSQGQQLFFSLLHFLGRASDCHSINARALSGEMDVHPTTLLHNGTHKASFGANQGVMQL